MPAVTLSFSLWFGFITAVVHGGFALDALPNAFSTLGLEGVDQVGSNQGPFSGWTRIPHLEPVQNFPGPILSPAKKDIVLWCLR